MCSSDLAREDFTVIVGQESSNITDSKLQSGSLKERLPFAKSYKVK